MKTQRAISPTSAQQPTAASYITQSNQADSAPGISTSQTLAFDPITSTSSTQTNEDEAADYIFKCENKTLASEVAILHSLNIQDCSGNLCPIL